MSRNTTKTNYKHLWKSGLPALLVLILIFVLSGPVAFGGTGAIQHQEQAAVLQQLQLFQGSTQGFDLDKVFTRAQGSVMLLRLLGWEDEALKAGVKTNFSDVQASHWAASSIAYANSKGLVKGVSGTRFAPNETMNGAQFITLSLRALGYTAAEPGKALEWCGISGLLADGEAAELIGQKVFLRDDMVAIAYKALSTKMYNSDKTLLQKLVEEDGSVSKAAALASGLYKEQPAAAVSNDPMDQIEAALRQALKP